MRVLPLQPAQALHALPQRFRVRTLAQRLVGQSAQRAAGNIRQVYALPVYAAQESRDLWVITDADDRRTLAGGENQPVQAH